MNLKSVYFSEAPSGTRETRGGFVLGLLEIHTNLCTGFAQTPNRVYFSSVLKGSILLIFTVSFTAPIWSLTVPLLLVLVTV